MQQDHVTNFKNINFQWEIALIAAGIAVSADGLFSIFASNRTTLISVFFIGLFFLFASVFQFAFAFIAHKWRAFALHVFLAFLYGLSGTYLIINPELGELALTFVLSFIFMVSGFSRVITSLFLRFHNWGWALVSGLISAGLGVYVYIYLKDVSLFLLGLLVGIDLLALGIYLINGGLYFKKFVHRPF
jgi:uncharacterized membrane protein HdeD (DUF308 family)